MPATENIGRQNIGLMAARACTLAVNWATCTWRYW